MDYVICLSTESSSFPSNEYGYWTGKTYKVEGMEYPVCNPIITEKTKRYSSKLRAESMARKLRDRCIYVMTWTVEPAEQNPSKEEITGEDDPYRNEDPRKVIATDVTIDNVRLRRENKQLRKALEEAEFQLHQTEDTAGVNAALEAIRQALEPAKG